MKNREVWTSNQKQSKNEDLYWILSIYLLLNSLLGKTTLRVVTGTKGICQENIYIYVFNLIV